MVMEHLFASCFPQDSNFQAVTNFDDEEIVRGRKPAMPPQHIATRLVW